MYEWQQQVQRIADCIDDSIINNDDESLTLSAIAKESGYSEFYMTRKFKQLSGVSFRDYLRKRRLAFALIEVRDTKKSLIEIAISHGFSSHEAFCRSFKACYGITPSAYRANPTQFVVLRTKLKTFTVTF